MHSKHFFWKNIGESINLVRGRQLSVLVPSQFEDSGTDHWKSDEAFEIRNNAGRN